MEKNKLSDQAVVIIRKAKIEAFCLLVFLCAGIMFLFSTEWIEAIVMFTLAFYIGIQFSEYYILLNSIFNQKPKDKKVH